MKNQAQVKRECCLPKDQHDYGISGRGPGKLHTVSQLVWSDALQHKLADIRVLTFIPFQRNSEKPNSDHEGENKDGYGQ
ncbi:MAG TPA: hypothetical protein VGI60_02395 [Chthoniobacterales bacterium]|jgi:hypothetical protein